MKSNEHSSIQAHSMGELFPCIIARCERYPDGESAATAAPSTSWELTLDGRAEEYATRDDAEMVARALLVNAALRARWARKARPGTMAHAAGSRLAIRAAAHAMLAGARDANPGRAVDMGGRHE